MAVYDGKKVAHEHLLDAAKHIVQGTLHAPQTTGQLNLKTLILTGDELEYVVKIFQEIARVAAFVKISAESYSQYFPVSKDSAMILLGADLSNSETDWNCGACGFRTCAEFNKYAREHRGRGRIWGGPSCNWKALDYGIASAWACDIACRFGIENRIMGSAGLILSAMGYMEDCTCVSGLPLGPCVEKWWYDVPVHRPEYELWEALMETSLPYVAFPFVGTGKPMIKMTEKWWEKPQFLKVQEDPQFLATMGEVQKKVGGIIMEARKHMGEKQGEG